MTWNPLKKNHLTTRPSPVPQVLDKTEERNLEIIFQKLQNLEETTKRLQKDMKKYLDSVSNVAKTEQKITSNLSTSALSHQNEEFRKLTEDYHSVTSQLSSSARELSTVNQQTFQEPLKKFAGIFSNIDSAFHRREQLVQEWRNLAGKVRKLKERERTASNVLKLEREEKALNLAANELLTYHTYLLTELTQLFEKRSDFFRPTLQALIRSQLEYYGNTTRLFTHLVPNVNESSPSSAYLDPEFDSRISSKLDNIRALSIVRTKEN
ncbi:Bridging integrator 3 [Blattella germanica]|nr:Bridging integrator 3 [Blattella germanica]